MMIFKAKIKTLCTALAMAGVLYSCTDIENIDIQTPYTYSDQYYENLRAYKASDHQVAFMWFADYSSSHSLGVRFMGLPDSLDICSLWGGIPSNIPDKPNTFYNPTAYEEMKFVQEVKGTKMVYVTFPGIGNEQWRWLEKYFPTETAEDSARVIQAFGDSLLNIVYGNGIDGVDLDYEIDGDWMDGENLGKLVQYLGKYIGPKGIDKSKLLIVDGGKTFDGMDCLSYFACQSYASPSADYLQNVKFNGFVGKLPPNKFIITENIGDYYATGGVPFTEADGNQYTETGERLYSLQGMARWNPIQGKKGGFGAFFGQRDYNSNPPYYHFRRGIQYQNPAVK